MEPDAGGLARVGDRRHRVDRRRSTSCRPWRRAPPHRVRSSASGRRRNSSSTGDLARLEAEQPRRSLDRRVRLLRADDDAAAGRLARRGERGDRRRSRRCPRCGRAIPHGRPSSCAVQSSVRASSSVDAGEVRQMKATELSVAARSSARMPGSAALIGEVREEARALPVRDPGQQDLVEVAQDVGERLASFRRRRTAGGGGCLPARPARAPGSSPTRSRYRAAHSSAAAPSSRNVTSAASRSAATCACSAPAPSSATPAGLGNAHLHVLRAR